MAHSEEVVEDLAGNLATKKNNTPAILSSGLMPGFTLSIFLSALLLFSVQPMFAKMTLPMLGGAPNVWNTAMVFFQATLLAGYIYAHLLSKYASLRVQVGVHAVVLVAGMGFLPLAVAANWAPPAEGAPALWLMALYAVSIGLPFFALSATAPLLQRWFSYTKHVNAQDPYFLYAASNLGSLLSLLSFPVLIEPVLGTQQQAQVWTFGYYALAIAIVCSGALAFANRISQSVKEKAEEAAANESEVEDSISWRERLIWIGLAFVPSSLMLGVTSHFTVNISSAPFMWVLPLSLYLLTFVIVFSRKPLVKMETMDSVLPALIVMGLLLAFLHNMPIFILFALHLAVFFGIALTFHAKLAARRPGASKLTEFYIFMSVGGVFGGIFNALVAPTIFNNVYEYAIVLALSGLVVGGWPKGRDSWKEFIFPAATFALMTAVVFLGSVLPDGLETIITIVLLSSYVVIYLQNAHPIRFVGGLLAMEFLMVVIAPLAIEEGHQGTLFSERSFFGVTQVAELEIEGEIVNQFIHGNTIHNMQFRNPELSRVMISYFSEPGPWGQVMKGVRAGKGDALKVNVIGLGAGALACYATPKDQWTFYEIDPAIVRMARDPKYFTYLSECTPNAPVLIGDARLKIQSETPESIDLLLIDAFSSDAIPAHLVTREAMALYQSKVKDDGVMFFHTSNRYADVSSVVIELARDAGLEAREMLFNPEEDQPYYDLVAPANGVVVARSDVMSTLFDSNPEWKKTEPNPAVGVWTDDYSHILGALIAGMDGGTLDPLDEVQSHNVVDDLSSIQVADQRSDDQTGVE